MKISVNGQSLRTLQVKRWVIGRKLFKLTVPESVAEDSKARIEVRIHSEAGDRQARGQARHALSDLESRRPAVPTATGKPTPASASCTPVGLRAVEPHADLAHEVGVGGEQPVDVRQRCSDLLDAARAVDTFDLVDLGDHAASVPGARLGGTPGTLVAANRGLTDQQPVASGWVLAGIEPTVTVTVRLAPSPPVTASLILSPAA